MITAQELLTGPRLSASTYHRPVGNRRPEKYRIVAAYVEQLPRGVWFSGNGLRLMFKCGTSTVSAVLAERDDFEREWSFKTRSYGWVKV